MVTRHKNSPCIGPHIDSQGFTTQTNILDHLKQSAMCVVYGHVAWKAMLCTQGSYKLQNGCMEIKDNTAQMNIITPLDPHLDPRLTATHNHVTSYQPKYLGQNIIKQTSLTAHDSSSFLSTGVVLIVPESSTNVFTVPEIRTTPAVYKFRGFEAGSFKYLRTLPSVHDICWPVPGCRYLKQIVIQVMLWYTWLVNDQRSRNNTYDWTSYVIPAPWSQCRHDWLAETQTHGPR